MESAFKVLFKARKLSGLTEKWKSKLQNNSLQPIKWLSPYPIHPRVEVVNCRRTICTYIVGIINYL